MTLAEARGVRDALERYVKTTERLNLSNDEAAMLREWVIGDPLELADGLRIPPWRLSKQTSDGVELTWAIDLGHESGTRRWFVALVDRQPGAWKVRDLYVAHAHVRRPAR